MAFTLRPWGAFSLAAAASFAEGFPGTDAHHAHNELQFRVARRQSQTPPALATP